MIDEFLTKRAKTLLCAQAITMLCIVCDEDTDSTMELLTGHLWDEEEAGEIKLLITRDIGRDE